MLYSHDATWWLSNPCLEQLREASPALCNTVGAMCRPSHLKPAAELRADCFFIHGTLNGAGETAVLRDCPKLWGYVRAQASAFESVARIFVPYYRCVTFAHSKHHVKERWARAYVDVRDAFEAFLGFIGDRPFFVAGHSQGAVHAMRLLRDVVVPKLRDRLLGAYCPGIALCSERDAPLPLAWEPGIKGTLAVWNCALEHCAFADHLVARFCRGGDPPIVCLPRSVEPSPVYGWLLDGSPVLYYDAYDRRSVRDGLLRFYATTDRHRKLLPWFATPQGDCHANDFLLAWGDVRQNAIAQSSNPT